MLGREKPDILVEQALPGSYVALRVIMIRILVWVLSVVRLWIMGLVNMVIMLILLLLLTLVWLGSLLGRRFGFDVRRDLLIVD